MLHIFDFARETSFLALTVRLCTAVLCGGLIGLEREFKRRPAGFRTHILISLGASIAILTNLYLYQVMHLYTDISRLGAQVIAGIGFIGAGTILVTRRHRVKGLTTAAGLWTAAIIGLVCGAGYLECAFFVTAMVLLAELLLVRLEYRLKTKTEAPRLYVEYGKGETIETILSLLKNNSLHVADLEITRGAGRESRDSFCAMMELDTSRTRLKKALVEEIRSLDDVSHLEEF